MNAVMLLATSRVIGRGGLGVWVCVGMVGVSVSAHDFRMERIVFVLEEGEARFR